jgi:hypothetical protein
VRFRLKIQGGKVEGYVSPERVRGPDARGSIGQSSCISGLWLGGKNGASSALTNKQGLNCMYVQYPPLDAPSRGGIRKPGSWVEGLVGLCATLISVSGFRAMQMNDSG